MNVSLTDELEKFVHAKVASGMYLSASEVVREALRLLAERDRVKELRLEELRREIQIGLDQLENGKGRPSETVFRELRERLDPPTSTGAE